MDGYIFLKLPSNHYRNYLSLVDCLECGEISPEMNCCHIVFVGFIFQFSCLCPVRAQESSDSLLHQEAISGIHRIYLSEIGDNAQIYHGTEYIRNGQKALGFPYYESDSMLTGSVNYLGTEYLDMNLFYNLVTDEIIIPNFLHNAFIVLPPGKLYSFTLGTHRFIQINGQQIAGLPLDGFYEQLVQGEPGLYARREKRLVSGTGSDESKYIQYNTYYLRKSGLYYVVDDKKKLLDLLKDQNDLLKKYIRANKLKFKKDLESSLVLTTIYYSRLKH